MKQFEATSLNTFNITGYLKGISFGSVSDQLSPSIYVSPNIKFDSNSLTERIDERDNPVFVEGNEIKMNLEMMKIGKKYSVIYDNKEHLVRMPKEGVIEIYEVVDPIWKKLIKFFP